MPDVVIVDAVRTPVGRRNGGLSTVHPADLLAAALSELIRRTGIDAAQVGQFVGGAADDVEDRVAAKATNDRRHPIASVPVESRLRSIPLLAKDDRTGWRTGQAGPRS